MNSIPLQQLALEAIPSPEGLLPFENNLVKLTQKDYIELKWQASFWKALHERVAARENTLKEQLKQKMLSLVILSIA